MRDGRVDCWEVGEEEGEQIEDENDVIVSRIRKRGMVESSVSRMR